MSKVINEIEREQLKTDVPAFSPGDTVVVQVRVKERSARTPGVGCSGYVGRRGDILKRAPEVAKKAMPSVGIGKEEIGPFVPIIIPGANSRDLV